MSIEDIKDEFRMSYDRHDAWGCVMNAWFDIAEALYIRGDGIPSQWEFVPGAGIQREASWLHDYESNVLCRFGNILFRWARMLKNAGLDY